MRSGALIAKRPFDLKLSDPTTFRDVKLRNNRGLNVTRPLN